LTELIRLDSVSKNFGPVQALKNVNLSLHAGEVHSLIGENGAGKSTLMKVLSGVYPHGTYSGDIFVGNKPAQFHSTHDAEVAGIALIHQELSTFPDLSVAENMVVGHWTHKNGFIDFKKNDIWADAWLKKLDADFESSRLMSHLSVGQQQIVEIAKALSRQSKILILDEPTSSLTQKEISKLFIVLKSLKEKGYGLVYISHRMEEIFSLSDRVSVLRDGESVFTEKMSAVTPALLIKHMVGRSIDQFYPEQTVQEHIKKNTILDLKSFEAKDVVSEKQVGPFSFSIRQGEILGFSGLLGAGRSELFKALCGDERYQISGAVTLNGENFYSQSVHHSISKKIGLVSEDRKTQSLLPSRSLIENTGIVRLAQMKFINWVSHFFEQNQTQIDLKVLNTKFSSADQLITELSGGNQQKVIFARVLQNNPNLIILDEPTRGVDVGAKFEIYQLMRKWAEAGQAIALISSDLPELMAMSDRVIVLCNGQMTAEFKKSEFDQEKIMKAAIKH
jgi:D-xylose transport system ATP-binding protein